MMACMSESFHLRTSDGSEWITHPAADSDGYVCTADEELRADGVTARTTVTLSVGPSGRTDLAVFLSGLAADWRGWDGRRRWQAMEHEMSVEAWHDRRASVMLAVTVRRLVRAYADDAWSACVVFTVEAGEGLAALSRGMADALET